MTAVCRGFVETRIEDLDSILGMLFMQSDEKPLHVVRSTFVNFMKNDLKVAISEKDLDLFMSMNGLF